LAAFVSEILLNPRFLYDSIDIDVLTRRWEGQFSLCACPVLGHPLLRRHPERV